MSGLSDLSRLGQDLTAAFEPKGELGRGGFGVVHRAVERATGREVALKLLQAGNPVSLERFIREATIAAGLDHPAVVRVHGAGHWSGQPCIVYELVEGQTLEEAWRGLPPRRRAEMVRDAAEGVACAHAQGVIHRDLKPANVLVDRAGRVRVADFGLAWQEGGERLTRTGALVGTPHFMAPELLDSGSARAGPRSDVWSLGVLLYEALTGVLPYPAANLLELMGSIQRGPTRPRELAPDVHPALEAVCLRALAAAPEARHADAGELARELSAALEGRAPRSARSRGPKRAALAMAALALIVLGATLRRRDGPPAAAPQAAPTPSPARPAPVEAPSLRWRLEAGSELRVRLTCTRGVPPEAEFVWTYGVVVEEVEPARVVMTVRVLASKFQAWTPTGEGAHSREAGPEGGPLVWWLDPRTGESTRVRGITEQAQEQPDGLVTLFKDEHLQSSFERLLHLLPADGVARPRWSFPFPLTAQPDGPAATRVCESTPLPGGGLKIVSRVEALPPELAGQYSLEGEAEWSGGRLRRASFQEHDPVITLGDTRYAWELLE